MRGRQGGIPLTLSPPKTGLGVKGYLGPVVVFMGICIKLIEHLDGLQTLLVSNFEGKIWRGIKKLSICGIFLLNYNVSNFRVMCGMSDSFSYSRFLLHTSPGDFL